MNKTFWSFQNKGNKTGELTLYGDIASSTWWGDEVTPKQFKKELDALGNIDILNVYINSPGGDVFAGQTIHSMLKRHKAVKNVYIDGLAASIASVVAMAGDKIYMPANAMMMIHNPVAGMMGYFYAVELRKMAEDLDKVGIPITNVYSDRTGLPAGELKKLMDEESWFTADEAVKLGFADELLKSKNIAASISNGFLDINGLKVDLSKYKNTQKLPLNKTNDEELVKLYRLKLKNNERRMRLSDDTRDLQKKLYEDLKRRADLS